MNENLKSEQMKWSNKMKDRKNSNEKNNQEILEWYDILKKILKEFWGGIKRRGKKCRKGNIWWYIKKYEYRE